MSSLTKNPQPANGPSDDVKGLTALKQLCTKLGWRCDPTLTSLVITDLVNSGIQPRLHASSLGLRVHTAAETKQLTGFDIPSYSFPYQHPITGKPMTFNDSGKPQPFIRYKLLWPSDDDGLRTKADRTKRPKYMQAKDSGCHLYFPVLPSLDWNWQEVAKDSSYELIVSEGEKKSIAGCLYLGPTIAVAGVDSINLEDLDLLDWRGRQVTIVFDREAIHKPQVRVAEQKLGRLLAQRRATVYFKRLPLPQYPVVDASEDADE